MNDPKSHALGFLMATKRSFEIAQAFHQRGLMPDVVFRQYEMLREDADAMMAGAERHALTSGNSAPTR